MAKKTKDVIYDGDTGLPVESSGRDKENKSSVPLIKLNTLALDAFIKKWKPVHADEFADEKLYIIDLRTQFQCYTTDDARCIDLLPYYLDELAESGFGLIVDFMGRQYMPVKHRIEIQR